MARGEANHFSLTFEQILLPVQYLSAAFFPSTINNQIMSSVENQASETESIMFWLFDDDNDNDMKPAADQREGDETATENVKDQTLSFGSPISTIDPTQDYKKRPADLVVFPLTTPSLDTDSLDSPFSIETSIAATPVTKKLKMDNMSDLDFPEAFVALPNWSPLPGDGSLDSTFLLETAPSAMKHQATVDSPDPNDFSKLFVPNLRIECVKRGLKVSGNKAELLERLQNPKVAEVNRKKGDYTETHVNSALESMGCVKPEYLSSCARCAIQKGFVRLVDGLDQVVATSTCGQCHQQVDATLRACLNQPDYAGLDYERGNETGAIQCQDCGIGQYVSNMCSGSFDVTSGEFHNHCSECPGLGKCLGDYRILHCCFCDEHYFTGLPGVYCPCTESQDKMTGQMCDMTSGHTIGAWLGDHEDVLDEEKCPHFETSLE